MAEAICILDDCEGVAAYSWDGKPICRFHGDGLLRDAKFPPTLTPWKKRGGTSVESPTPSELDWETYTRVCRWLIEQNLDWLKEMAKR